MPNLKFKEFLRKVTTEDIINKMTEGSHACPPAVGSVDMNTFNRDKTTRKHNYGPLNVDEPGDYWIKVAKQWRATIKAAKMSLCANCIAFDISPRMKECMPGVSSDGEGELGYCWMHHFKCHSRRSCNTWAKGGPIVDDKVSYTWHDRSNLEESKIDEAVLAGRDYKYDGKGPIKISKKMYAKVQRNSKSMIKGKPYMMALNPKTQGTELVPVKFEEIEEDAPANSVSAGGVDMAPNAGHPNLMMKHKKKNKKDQEILTKKIGNMIKDKKDNNNNTLKGVNETLDLIDNVIDEVSGVDYTIKFKEEKKYKSFSEKFGVGK